MGEQAQSGGGDWRDAIERAAQDFVHRQFGQAKDPPQRREARDAMQERLEGEIRQRLVRALNRERALARSGNPGYDANRHIALHQQLRRLERETAAPPDALGRKDGGR
jgi:hypothetical protein